MRRTDAEIIEKIKMILAGYLEDQDSLHPRYRIADIPDEINGRLTDMIYLDKVENDTLVHIISLLVRSKQASDQEILKRLRDIYDALCLLDTRNNLTNPNHSN